MTGKNLEICLNSDNLLTLPINLNSAFIAGANRVELCSSMHLDGLSPDSTAIKLCAQQIPAHGELLVMIRPVANTFVANNKILNKMIREITRAADLGATGVVFGAISKSEIDINTTQKLVLCAQKNGLKTTFHRAFDCINDKQQAIKQLIDLGIDRVLTNGNHWNANQPILHNLYQLEQLIEEAQNQIEIVIGGGVTTKNAGKLWQLADGNLVSLHTHSGVLNNKGYINPLLISEILDTTEKQALND